MSSLRLPAVFLTVALVLVPVVPARAHANYRGSDPANKSEVDNAPSEVWAEFSEPLEDDSHMEVYDPCGMRVDGGNTEVTGYRMTVTMSSDSSGTFVVAWTAASAIDPHVTKGNFTFRATSGTDCSGGGEEAGGSEEEEGTKGRSSGRRDRRSSTSAGSTGPASAGKAEGAGDRAGKGEARHRKHHRRAAKVRLRARSPRVDASAAAQQRPDSDAGEDEIPIGGLMAALGLAALIGASGGLIYAGILGPRRRPG